MAKKKTTVPADIEVPSEAASDEATERRSDEVVEAEANPESASNAESRMPNAESADFGEIGSMPVKSMNLSQLRAELAALGDSKAPVVKANDAWIAAKEAKEEAMKVHDQKIAEALAERKKQERIHREITSPRQHALEHQVTVLESRNEKEEAKAKRKAQQDQESELVAS